MYIVYIVFYFCFPKSILNVKSVTSSPTILVWLVFITVFFLRGFLPLAFSKQPPWFWMSMVPAPCSPVMWAQLESSCPQTGVHSSNTAGAESHNPAGGTSLHSCLCQCLVPCPADGPVDLPWMSSSPCKRM